MNTRQWIDYAVETWDLVGGERAAWLDAVIGIAIENGDATLEELEDYARMVVPPEVLAASIKIKPPRRRRLVLVGALLGLLAGGLPACDTALFYCEGQHPSLNEPLCFCSQTGELCSHPGFGACIECPIEE